MLRLESIEHRKSSVDRDNSLKRKGHHERGEMRNSITERAGLDRYSTIDTKREDELDKEKAKAKRAKKNGFYISSFEGAHLSMQAYNDKYESEKNFAIIEDSTKGNHVESSSLQW